MKRSPGTPGFGLVFSLLMACLGSAVEAAPMAGVVSPPENKGPTTASQESTPTKPEASPPSSPEAGLPACKAALEGNKFDEAFKCLGPLAKQGDAEAQHLLAKLYIDGKGTAKNSVLAVLWLRKAANQGNEEAMILLANMYISGQGVAQNIAKAVALLQKPADNGNIQAQLLLGQLLLLHSPEDDDSCKKGLALLQKLADQGNAEAEYNLGMLYVTISPRQYVGSGYDRFHNDEYFGALISAYGGVSCFKPEGGEYAKYAKGEELLQKAAMQDHADALKFLGLLQPDAPDNDNGGT